MKTMTPSKPVTEGQIGKLNEKLTARLLKHKAEIPSDIFQEILGDETLMDEFHAAVRKRVERMSNRVVRTVTVNRTRSAREALKATGRTLYATDSVVDAMPQGIGEIMEVVFFKRDRYLSDDELEKEYEVENLMPADPFSLAAVNEADPAFADTHPNATHWKDAAGKWCCAAFCRFDGERSVDVDRSDYDWRDYWWFAGFRKSASGLENQNS